MKAKNISILLLVLVLLMTAGMSACKPKDADVSDGSDIGKGLENVISAEDELLALIEQVPYERGDYDEAGWNELMGILDEAIALLEDPNATEDQFKEMVERLRQAFEALGIEPEVLNPQGGGNTTASKSGGGTGTGTGTGTLPTNPSGKVDLGGYEFSLFAQTYWIFDGSGDTTVTDKVRERYEQIEKTYNCKITVIETNQETYYEDLSRSNLSGTKIADFIYLANERSMGYIANGSVRPLSMVKNFDVKKDYYNAAVTGSFTHNGKIYGVQIANRGTASGVIMLYNRDLLNKSGCEDPYDLWKSGNWTFDVFETMLSKLTKKQGGNTVQWGFTSADWDGNNCEKPFLYANGAQILVKDSKGIFQNGLLLSNAQKAMEYLKRWEYEYGYYKPNDGGAYGNVAEMDKIGFFVDRPQIASYVAAHEDHDINFGLVPLPKGPNATEHVAMAMGYDGWMMQSCVSDADAEKAAFIFDKIAAPLFGSVKADADANNLETLENLLGGDKKNMEVIAFSKEKTIMDTGRYLTFYGTDGDYVGRALISAVRTSNFTPKAAMESVSGQVAGGILAYYDTVKKIK